MNDVLLDLCIKGRGVLDKYLPAASCVSSTRFAIEYLKTKDIFSRPLPVHLVTYIDGLVVVGRKPRAEVPEVNWNGHLVAYVEESIILDLSLPQIGLPPAYFEAKDFPAACDLAGKVLLYLLDRDFLPFAGTAAWEEKWKEPFQEYI